jgi:ABC transport system ATP-binding/permease protein
MWKLVIEDDEGKRTVVPLTRDDYTIGRQEGNTIRLTERNVSRQHGRVRRNRAGNGASKDIFVLEDLRSYNGVFVNGLRVAHTQDLTHGDLIQIGDYRIVLQDDAVSAIETAAIPVTTTEPDAKATIPMAASFRGQAMTERPNRLVMLVGPTPGVEYPLDRERMTIGRAEDASISVNHNSVSRLHCEVHALGDGRFEIVDKGSSNGVRVNAVELKRSIIEAGDVIELGDVRFKFVGAGQVFVPGPNESQQLTAISDREAELADSRSKGFAGYLLPIGAAIVVGLVVLALGFVWVRSRSTVDLADASNAAADTAEVQLVKDARKNCNINECEQAHLVVTTQIREGSQVKSSTDFAEIESIWADSILKKASMEQDPAAKKALLKRLLDTPTIDAAKRKAASDMYLLTPDTPGTVATDLPTPVPTAPTAPSNTTAPPTPRPPVTSHTTVTNATTTSPTSQPTPPPTPTKPVGPSQTEKAREALLAGNVGEVRRILETKVRSGHGSLDEAGMLRAACKAQRDQACKDDIDAKYPNVPK